MEKILYKTRVEFVIKLYFLKIKKDLEMDFV